MIKFDNTETSRVGYKRVSIAIMELIEDGLVEVKNDGA